MGSVNRCNSYWDHNHTDFRADRPHHSQPQQSGFGHRHYYRQSPIIFNPARTVHAVEPLTLVAIRERESPFAGIPFCFICGFNDDLSTAGFGGDVSSVPIAAGLYRRTVLSDWQPGPTAAHPSRERRRTNSPLAPPAVFGGGLTQGTGRPSRR